MRRMSPLSNSSNFKPLKMPDSPPAFFLPPSLESSSLRGPFFGSPEEEGEETPPAPDPPAGIRPDSNSGYTSGPGASFRKSFIASLMTRDSLVT